MEARMTVPGTISVPRPARPSRWRQWAARVTGKVGAFGVTAALGLGALAALAPQCGGAPAPTFQQQVIDIVNQRRAENGLGALSVDGALSNAAQGHSNDQAWVDRLSHSGTDGSDAGARIANQGYRAWAWGENVAAGYGNPDSVMRGWMSSSGHRANILSGNFTQIGVGLAYAADGTPYWTMDLGRPG